jgi:hypothetical protein
MPDALCRRIKNPINYTFVKARALQNPGRFKEKKEKKEN